MALLCVTVAIAFSAGFCAAALLGGGRRHDAQRSGGLLAQTVESFTQNYSDRSCDVGGRVSIARSQLDQLDRALEVRDELLSA